MSKKTKVILSFNGQYDPPFFWELVSVRKGGSWFVDSWRPYKSRASARRAAKRWAAKHNMEIVESGG